MLSEGEMRFNQALTNIADALDIPESKFEDAIEKFKAVGKWLDANDSQLHIYMPRIYAQGSFRLGTVIKPLSDKDEYDVDLVCHLEINKKNITQSDLKNIVGSRLKTHQKYKDMLVEGRRCWTLNYANEFHMDILPSIPDYEKLNDSILITDKKLRNWQPSNPKGYARWFMERMKEIFVYKRQILAETMKAKIEDIPEWKVKTPLQRVIQILKRHRDIYFQNDQDDKPVSIIITTLAAHTYNGEVSVIEAIKNISHNMSTYIISNNGSYWVPNPTNPEENFADKWNEHPERRKKFMAWLEKLNTDIDTALQQDSLATLEKNLRPVLGELVNLRGIQYFNVGARNKQKDEYPRVSISNPVKPWCCQ